jgi:outer membrane protein assembly factor BamB
MDLFMKFVLGVASSGIASGLSNQHLARSLVSTHKSEYVHTMSPMKSVEVLSPTPVSNQHLAHSLVSTQKSQQAHASSRMKSAKSDHHVASRTASANLQTPLTDFWPTALGPGQNGSVGVVAPPMFLTALNWSWQHPGGKYHTTLAGGPVIDADKNLYLTANDGIRKFSPDGQMLWHFNLDPPRDMSTQASLAGDVVYGVSNEGYSFAVNRTTGAELWHTYYGSPASSDVGYPSAKDGVFVIAMEAGSVPNHEGGCKRIVGVNTTNGETLWDYRPEWPSWNFMPIFLGDGTLIFMDFTGGVYRLGLHNGTEIWHTRAHDLNPTTNVIFGTGGVNVYQGMNISFTDGGVTVGAGMAFTCSNPQNFGGQEGTKGALRAYGVNDGQLLWERILPQPCNSWPAVGSLGWPEEGPSVVVTPGAFMGTDTMHGGVMAFDAVSGALQWKWQAPVYQHVGNMAMGDVEGQPERLIFDPRHSICLPAHWSAPLITDDGAVLVGRSDGVLYKIRGPVGPLAQLWTGIDSLTDLSWLTTDFVTTLGVTVEDQFNSQGSALHGALASAPGLFAYATCTDTLYVFKY